MKVRFFLIKFDFNICPCNFNEWMLVHTHTRTRTHTRARTHTHTHTHKHTTGCAIQAYVHFIVDKSFQKNQFLSARHQVYTQKSRSRLHEQVTTYDSAIIMLSVGIKKLNVTTVINEYSSWDFQLVTPNNTVLYQVKITLRIVIYGLLGSAKYFHIFV